jgi:hypothetical protein
MRNRLLGASLLALFAWDPAAHAAPFDFSYTGSLITFTVPVTGTYQIVAFGAQGGGFQVSIEPPIVGLGGMGAEIGGDFDLAAGDSLQIAVGSTGNTDGGGGGGGGGSFVVGPGNMPLIIAGGGGGTGEGGGLGLG